MSQVRVYDLATALVAYSDRPPTKAMAKALVQKIFPGLDNVNELRRTKSIAFVAQQLWNNGWLESEECQQLRALEDGMRLKVKEASDEVDN